MPPVSSKKEQFWQIRNLEKNVLEAKDFKGFFKKIFLHTIEENFGMK